jgi:hypothetical protein
MGLQGATINGTQMCNPVGRWKSCLYLQPTRYTLARLTTAIERRQERMERYRVTISVYSLMEMVEEIASSRNLSHITLLPAL